LAKSSGIGVLLGVGLLYFLFSKKKPSNGLNGNGLNGNGFGGGGGGVRNGDLPETATDDPLTEGFGAVETSFVSKKSGVVSPGMYTKPFVRRKGVLKPVIKGLPLGGGIEYIR
jgi:hypothetical protein